MFPEVITFTIFITIESCLILKHRDKEVLKKAKEKIEQWLSTCEIEGKIVQFDFNPMNAF